MDSCFGLVRPHQHGIAKRMIRVSQKIIDPAVYKRGEPEGCFKPQLHMNPYGSYGWDCATVSAIRKEMWIGFKASFRFASGGNGGVDETHSPGYAMLMRPNKAETAVHGCLSKGNRLYACVQVLYSSP